MIEAIAVANYRSIRDLVLPLGRLNVITGPNGSGKSNLYRALRLLAETARGGVTATLAREGGLGSVLWAGPESISRGMRSGHQPVQGGPRRKPIQLRLGFAAQPFSFAIDFGLPKPAGSAFDHDPEIKREAIWHGPVWRPGAALVNRTGPMVVSTGDGASAAGESAAALARGLASFDSMLGEVADPFRAPEVLAVREMVRSWRFYDHFRTDADAPARQLQVGTRTPVLGHDGADLAAALETIRLIGDHEAMHAAIDDAFPGARLEVSTAMGRFGVNFYQHGLLRPLDQSELSDGTLRYLLWVAALLTPRPPALMVLNEPETSLHPDLLPALGRLIVRASKETQVWVVTHATRLVAALECDPGCTSTVLEKDLGETRAVGQDLLDAPPWKWPAR